MKYILNEQYILTEDNKYILLEDDSSTEGAALTDSFSTLNKNLAKFLRLIDKNNSLVQQEIQLTRDEVELVKADKIKPNDIKYQKYRFANESPTELGLSYISSKFNSFINNKVSSDALNSIGLSDADINNYRNAVFKTNIDSSEATQSLTAVLDKMSQLIVNDNGYANLIKNAQKLQEQSKAVSELFSKLDKDKFGKEISAANLANANKNVKHINDVLTNLLNTAEKNGNDYKVFDPAELALIIADLNNSCEALIKELAPLAAKASYEKADKTKVATAAQGQSTIIDWKSFLTRVAKSETPVELTDSEFDRLKNRNVIGEADKNKTYDDKTAWLLYLKAEWGDDAKAIQELGSSFANIAWSYGFSKASNPIIKFLDNNLHVLPISFHGFKAIYEALRTGILKADYVGGITKDSADILACPDFYAQAYDNAFSYLIVQSQAKNAYKSNLEKKSNPDIAALPEDLFIKTLFTGDLLSNAIDVWDKLNSIDIIIDRLKTIFPNDKDSFSIKDKSKKTINAFDAKSLGILSADRAALYISLILSTYAAKAGTDFKIDEILNKYKYDFNKSNPEATLANIMKATKQLNEYKINKEDIVPLCDIIAEAGHINK